MRRSLRRVKVCRPNEREYAQQFIDKKDRVLLLYLPGLEFW
jgi:hypothetical protein